MKSKMVYREQQFRILKRILIKKEAFRELIKKLYFSVLKIWEKAFGCGGISNVTMRFYMLLKAGASVENVVKEFVQELLRNSWQEEELDMQLTCDFVNDILAAIGLDCLVTPEQIDEGGNYIWPMEQILIYNFHYVAMDFRKLEEFLYLLCKIMQFQHDIFLEEVKGYPEDGCESPVEFLMQLIAVWCNVYKQLQKLEELQANKRFEEPLARINFYLLCGMHDLRKMYRLDLYLLDAICQRLYWSALQGLFYKQTHEVVFNGLLNIFSEDFDLFYNNNASTINFFYTAFSVEFNNSTPLILYQTLQKMLNELENEEKLKIITNFLIEPFMLEVYFTTLLGKLSKKNVDIQREGLKFLNVLQSKLISLDCFSREFMESILNLIFKTDVVISNLACNLYITMMKRKFSNEMILKHFLNFYVTHVVSIVHLKSSIFKVYTNFKFLLDFNNLLEIITDNSCTAAIRLLTAHMLVIVFEIKYQENSFSNQPELEHLLEILPEIFENLQCQQCEGILLQIYFQIPLDRLKKPTLDNLIHYTVGVFAHIDNNLEYPLLMNLFQSFHKCLIINREWQHLEILTQHLLSKYREMIRDLKRREQEQKQKQDKQLISELQLLHYNNLLKRLNIILKTKYELLDNNYLEIINDLLHFFIYNSEIKSLTLKHKSLIDLYALEIIVSLILKVIKIQSVILLENTSFALQIQKLFNYLWSYFKDVDNLFKSTVIHVKTFFCCLLNLCSHLPLKLDTQDYYQLVQVLIVLNFKNKTFNRQQIWELQQSHLLQSLMHQRLMLLQFTEMHRNQKLQINTNCVWKLCIYYGMLKHPFNKELEKLIITLANNRLQIYKNIIAIIIYNLHKQTPALRSQTIMFILKQHKHLIDNVIRVESPALLNVHVVLMVLQILEKALSVQRMKTGHNRLEALRHLNIFIEDLNLSQLQAKQLIIEQLSLCEKHLITAEERKFLDNFKAQVLLLP